MNTRTAARITISHQNAYCRLGCNRFADMVIAFPQLDNLKSKFGPCQGIKLIELYALTNYFVQPNN